MIQLDEQWMPEQRLKVIGRLSLAQMLHWTANMAQTVYFVAVKEAEWLNLNRVQIEKDLAEAERLYREGFTWADGLEIKK